MEFKKYDDPNIFWQENKDLLLEKEWLNNLIVGNCMYATNNGIDENWLLARITNNGKTELIILLRKPWKLLLYSPTSNKSDELYSFAAKNLCIVDQNIPGVNSEKEIAQKFADAYCEISGKKLELHQNMRILLLEKLATPQLRNDVIYRKANEKDKEILKLNLRKFYKEALDCEIDEKLLEDRFYKNFQKGYFVLEKDGKIVCQATSTKELIKGKTINEVYTPEEERGNGYAYNLIYRFSKEFLDNGAEYCVLFTDDTNPISNHVYEKIGYEKKVDTIELDFID